MQSAKTNTIISHIFIWLSCQNTLVVTLNKNTWDILEVTLNKNTPSILSNSSSATVTSHGCGKSTGDAHGTGWSQDIGQSSCLPILMTIYRSKKEMSWRWDKFRGLQGRDLRILCLKTNLYLNTVGQRMFRIVRLLTLYLEDKLLINGEISLWR